MNEAEARRHYISWALSSQAVAVAQAERRAGEEETTRGDNGPSTSYDAGSILAAAGKSLESLPEGMNFL